MARQPPPSNRAERQQPSDNKGRADQGDRSGTERRSRDRSGEGAESALVSLRNIERDRARSKPADEGSSNR